MVGHRTSTGARRTMAADAPAGPATMSDHQKSGRSWRGSGKKTEWRILEADAVPGRFQVKLAQAARLVRCVADESGPPRRSVR